MKKVFYLSLVTLLISCEYNDLKIRTCYLSSELTLSDFATYGYNSKNEIISYASLHVYSSAITYNDEGKITSELDNGIALLTFTYDTNGRLIILTQTVQSAPWHNYQIKYTYNSFNQDTLRQYYTYNSSGDYDLWRYDQRDFLSPYNKNYSQIRTYDASTKTLLYTEDFLWDNHPSPYLGNVFFLNGPPPTNNTTKYSYTSGSTTQSFEYTYTYNSNGFPLTKTRLSDNAIIRQYGYSNCH